MWLTPGDGIAGGGDANIGGWVSDNSNTFRSSDGGFVSATAGKATLAKWNFVGVGVKLWMPKGPEFGQVRIAVDGGNSTIVNLYSAEHTQSAPVFEWMEDEGDEKEEVTIRCERVGLAHHHAAAVRWVSGGMVADSVQFLPPPISS
jgi:hypothetical protein